MINKPQSVAEPISLTCWTYKSKKKIKNLNLNNKKEQENK
jgi:hypothetical protein